jgi:hypothetical protein
MDEKIDGIAFLNVFGRTRTPALSKLIDHRVADTFYVARRPSANESNFDSAIHCPERFPWVLLQTNFG